VAEEERRVEAVQRLALLRVGLALLLDVFAVGLVVPRAPILALAVAVAVEDAEASRALESGMLAAGSTDTQAANVGEEVPAIDQAVIPQQ